MSKSKTKCGIFILSIMLQSMNAVALVLSGVSADHPEASPTSIQLVFTLITLMSVAGTILAGKLANLMTKKKIAIIFSLVLCAGGLLAFFAGGSLPGLYASSVVIGIGNGVLFPITSALIVEHFEGGERATVTGLQAIFVCGGGMLFNIFGGMLANVDWRSVYLLFLAAVPIVIASIFLLPQGIVEEKKQGEKVSIFNPFLVSLMIMAFVFGLCWMTLNTNATYYVAELGIGNAQQASFLTIGMALGSVIIGILLRKVMHWAKKYCFLTAFAIATAGLWILFAAHSLVLLVLGSILLGIGFGLFMPSGYTLIPNQVSPSAITLSIALFTASFSIGGFFNPYVITLGASAISSSVGSRFLLAALIQTMNLILCLVVTKKIFKDETTTLE